MSTKMMNICDVPGGDGACCSNFAAESHSHDAVTIKIGNITYHVCEVHMHMPLREILALIMPKVIFLTQTSRPFAVLPPSEG